MKKLLSHKSGGNILHYTFNFVLVTIAAMLLFFGIQTRTVYTAKIRVQDALTSSLLAAAVPNAEIYATQGKLTLLQQNENITNAYAQFRQALKANMGLDDNLNIRADGYLTGAVSIRFVYYDAAPCNGNVVAIYTKSEGDFHGKQSPDALDISKLSAPVLTAQIGFTVRSFASCTVFVTYSSAVSITP